MKFHIRTFNSLFWFLIAVTVLLSYLYKLFYVRYQFYAKMLFLIIYIVMFAYFFYYKIKLCNDVEYQKYCEDKHILKSVLWSEILPLQLCNVAYILLPFGILFDIKSCIVFGLLVAPMCVLFSLLTPYPGLSDDSLLKPRIAGFYFTHLFILFMSLVIWTVKDFVLDYRLAFNTFILLFVCSAVAHITNLILHKSGLCKDANYFFTMDPNVSEITIKLYKLIPIKWVYEFPIYLLLLLVFDLITFIYNLW